MAGWEDLTRLIEKELRQRLEEGFDVSGFVYPNKPAWEDPRHVAAIWRAFENLPLQKEYPYIEPNDFESIVREYTPLVYHQKAIPLDRFHGAIIGRAIGCVLGKPLEVGPYFWESTKEQPGWKHVKKWFEGADAYPIQDYVPTSSKAAQEGLYVRCPLSQKDHLRFVESDDDIRYTLLALELLETIGFDFQPYDVGKLWHRMLPYQFVCTAETQAYVNFATVTNHIQSDQVPYSKEVAEYVRTFANPYREWIGAQIRVDGYAYAAAGDPLFAAKLAYQDASFSHVKNGVYGAMFFSALIASAFVESDIDQCIDQALRVIPSTSRLYAYLQKTISIAKRIEETEPMIEAVWEYLLDFDPAHTINNACICVASILHGHGDFTRSIATAVLFGLDTDCNGATVGSFVGALQGFEKIPSHWKEPLHDTIHAQMIGYDPVSIADVAKRFRDLRNHRIHP